MDKLNKSIGFVSLGCDKNRVDLERMIYNIKNSGFNIVCDPNDADIIIINTCAFIKPAREESINAILEMSQFKQKKCEKLIVTGCLCEMGYSDLNSSLPEVDAFVSVKDNDNIVKVIYSLYGFQYNYPAIAGRILTTEKHFAYLKIAEGCNNFCTYCTIPFIRGRYKSECIETLIEEANKLVEDGVEELILVAQDTTKYGIDLYGEKKIVKLIKELSKIEKLKWIRLLYCYPEEIDDDLICEIASNNKVCKYLDIPLQHVDNDVLKRMNRHSSYEKIVALLKKLREKVKDIVIRSTFIVGFPSETDEEFNNLKKFILEYKLNYVGFFIYSKEEETKAGKMKGQISSAIKKNRLKDLTLNQKQNTIEYHKTLLNHTYLCILDRVVENIAYFRASFQCPNVDPFIMVKCDIKLNKRFYNVKIINQIDYDLIGEIV